MKTWFQCALLLVMLPGAACAFAQPDAAPPSTISVTTRIVAADALVRNADGSLALTLTKDAFALKVDGKPTEIRYFNRDSDLPLTVGLLIDTSGSQRVYFDEEALAGETFLNNILTHTNDRAFLVRFDARVETMQPLTSRIADLRNALRRFDYPTAADKAAQRATLLYDAVASVSQNVLAPREGRRALLVLTDGEDFGSRASLNDCIRQAQLHGVTVFAVLFTTESIGGTLYPRVPGTRTSGVEVMRQIAKATGGRAFVAGGSGMSVADIFSAIEQDLRSQYRFGFTPMASKAGKYHSVELRTNDRTQTVQTRAGYITPDGPASP